MKDLFTIMDNGSSMDKFNFIDFIKLERDLIHKVLEKYRNYHSRDCPKSLFTLENAPSASFGTGLLVDQEVYNTSGTLIYSNRILWIDKKDDEWFIVYNYEGAPFPRQSFRCDQIDGLLACIESILVDINI